MIKLEETEEEQTGLTKVNTFKTKRFNVSIQPTAKMCVSLKPEIDTVELCEDRECMIKE